MQIEWVIGALESWEADAVLFFAFEKASERMPGLERWVRARARSLDTSPSWSDFKGKPQQLAVLYCPEDPNVPRVICCGLGPVEKFEIDKLRTALAQALRRCRELQLGRVLLPLIALEGLPTPQADSLKEALMGALLGLHRYIGYKTRDVEPADWPEVLLIGSGEQPQSALEQIPTDVSALSLGICMARDLVSAPANHVTPGHLAEVAKEISQRQGQRLQVISFDEAREMGMGAFSAVAQGSREPAYVIVMEHQPPGTADQHPLVFVGKGITFDTGGISLKPSDKMEAMKQDMAGAAAVLGTFEVLGRIGLKRRVIGIMPCTENMPSGQAYKPGDVIQSISGLTIEIISTDAEGRMVLCDALTLAQRYKPALLVDLATLTGAALIALGTQVAAIMGNKDLLVRKVQELGGAVGERFWPLPLYDFYFEGIKSEVADFKNVGDRTAGTIIGGIFLKQFVSDDVPWVHWDIAGTAWTSKDMTVCPLGGTGFGVRTLVELARQWDDLGIAS